MILSLLIGGAALAWDEATQGPLPRWREGGTPEPGPGQRLTPYSIDIPKPLDVPATCGVTSPPEYSPTEGVLMRYSPSAWPTVVTDLVAALTGDPTNEMGGCYRHGFLQPSCCWGESNPRSVSSVRFDAAWPRAPI